MNTTTFNTNTTIEQADALVELLGYTDLVEDYEFNENGHVYSLETGNTLVVTGSSTYEFIAYTYGTSASTVEQADQMIDDLGYTDQVEDYEMTENGHVYSLDNGSVVVIAWGQK